MDKTSGQYQKLPPGWDCKYDQATGNCYYINYFTKAMQLEDPRMRYKQLQNDRSSTESIPMQPMHGSPYHVYPSNNMPAMRAFQSGGAHNANPSLLNMSASPLLSASRGQLEMSPLPYPRTTMLQQTPRLGNMSRRSTIQETSFTNQFDTDGVVTKIQNMFPTASENHIRLLLKKYYNREAVVISALQVEKHPVTMPGPYVTPPAQRHLYHSNSAFYMTPPSRRLDIGAGNRSGGLGSSTSRTASPVPGGRFGGVMSMHSGGGYGAVAGGGGGYGGAGIGYGASNAFAYAPLQFHGSPRFGEQWRSSPKPHSSPKMKLRYMKNIFPKADEMLLLDILSASDNNVQQASEKLIALGYQKRDFAALKAAQKSTTHGLEAPKKKPGDEQIIPLRPKEHTAEEKEAMRQMLKSRYPQIAERIIIMALESVNYAEDRAIQILQIVQDEDEARAKKHAAALQLVPMPDHTELDGITAEAVVAGHDATDKQAQRDSTEANDENAQQQNEFKSLLGRIATMGHNTELVRGPDEHLLLADYVTWNGANPDMPHGQKSLAIGTDTNKLSERNYVALGRNPDLCKGAKSGLAKGSIYAQLAASSSGKSTNIKCK